MSKMSKMSKCKKMSNFKKWKFFFGFLRYLKFYFKNELIKQQISFQKKKLKILKIYNEDLKHVIEKLTVRNLAKTARSTSA